VPYAGWTSIDYDELCGPWKEVGASAAVLESPFLYVTGTDALNGGDYRRQIERRLLDSGAGCWTP
jgi:hypothetical protein